MKKVDREEREGERPEKIANSSKGVLESNSEKDVSKSGSSVVFVSQHQDLNAEKSTEPGASTIQGDEI